jgi:adenosylcobinamide kinase/adenosylcobinamide-phosphate guanylyltransferase
MKREEPVLMVVLVTGGARSGKSSFAEQYAAHLGSSGVYIATAQTLDEEMRTRASRHRDRRALSGFVWETIEEPYDLCGVLSKRSNPIILVDCLTLWLSNWLLHYEHEVDPESHVMGEIDRLTTVLSAMTSDIILVTNEVGDSVVPEYLLGRMFRDLAGTMNQRVASVSQQVFLVIAGLPIELKSKQFRFPDNGNHD